MSRIGKCKTSVTKFPCPVAELLSLGDLENEVQMSSDNIHSCVSDQAQLMQFTTAKNCRDFRNMVLN